MNGDAFSVGEVFASRSRPVKRLRVRNATEMFLPKQSFVIVNDIPSLFQKNSTTGEGCEINVFSSNLDVIVNTEQVIRGAAQAQQRNQEQASRGGARET